MAQELHVSTKMTDGGRFVRPPTTAKISIKSMPSGAQVYLGDGPGTGSLKIDPVGKDTELKAELVA